jgi:hypothetical protein
MILPRNKAVNEEVRVKANIRTTEVSAIPIVSSYPYVFTPELPPPAGERGRVQLGPAPISKAPYRMEPAKLKELSCE